MKIEKVEIPEESILAHHIHKYDYIDSYTSQLEQSVNQSINSVDLACAFFSGTPIWVKSLFNLRNNIVRLFGLKTGQSQKSHEQIIQDFKGEVGEKVGLFEVFERTDREIVLGENDKHLDFRVSLLLTNKNPANRAITVSTLVDFHNWYGRLYFIPVKPFHKLIVKAMMRMMLKNLLVSSS